MKRLPYIVLVLLVVVALARDFLANDRPLWCTVEGQHFFPALRDMLPWSGARQYAGTALSDVEEKKAWPSLPAQSVLFPVVPFRPGHVLGAERGQPPAWPSAYYGGRFRHWLGTDEHGRDVAASMISGTRVALLTGLVAMGMALLIGVLLGLVAGYFGDDRLRLPVVQVLFFLLSIPVAWFYAFPARTAALHDPAQANALLVSVLIFAAVVAGSLLTGYALSRVRLLGKKVRLPADLLVMRAGEVFSVMPRLMVIVALAALADQKSQSTWLLLALIGAMSWPGVARLIRGEMLKVRELDFITAARGLGFSDWRIMLRHALPNALRPVLIAFALGLAGAIMLEVSLSILGYGLDANRSPSWGMLLQSAKANYTYWWLVVFPALAIAVVVMSLHAVVDGVSLNDGTSEHR